MLRYGPPFALRLDPEIQAKLDAIAVRNGVDRATVIRMAVTALVETIDAGGAAFVRLRGDEVQNGIQFVEIKP